MRIAAHTASAAVARTLQAIISAAGHVPTTSPHEAALVLCDTLHPAATALPEAIPRLLLGTSASAGEGGLPLPLSPHSLIQKLTAWQQTRLVPLQHRWQLDMLARQLTHPDTAAVPLTEKECALLGQLVDSPSQRLSREALLEAVWGVGSAVDTHTLETHIYRLRSKLSGLQPSPGDILTDQGAYQFVPGAAAG